MITMKRTGRKRIALPQFEISRVQDPTKTLESWALNGLEVVVAVFDFAVSNFVVLIADINF